MQLLLQYRIIFWVTFEIEIFNHIPDKVSDDARYDVIYCLFSAKIDDIYHARLCTMQRDKVKC